MAPTDLGLERQEKRGQVERRCHVEEKWRRGRVAALDHQQGLRLFPAGEFHDPANNVKK
jgi:hypothetical protein